MRHKLNFCVLIDVLSHHGLDWFISRRSTNEEIANFFKEIGLADELGSGIRKIVKYTKIYSGSLPEFMDDEIFKVKNFFRL